MFNPSPPGGRYSWEFLVGVCRPVLQILTLFQTKKYHFPYPFSDLSFRHKLSYHWLSLERKQNKSSPVRILFLSYLFGIETLNTFIYSRSSLENHTRFQTTYWPRTRPRTILHVLAISSTCFFCSVSGVHGRYFLSLWTVYDTRWCNVVSQLSPLELR